jgi:hypothetical protein
LLSGAGASPAACRSLTSTRRSIIFQSSRPQFVH